MKPAVLIGVILIAIGIMAFFYDTDRGGFTFTKREKVVDFGPLQVTADRQKTIPFPPIVGGICLVGGILLVLTGSKKS
jgi:hypothetical protein